MAGMAFARRVGESATEVRYAFGATPAADEGVLVIPVADVDAWRVEGADDESDVRRDDRPDDRPLSARWALLKVLRMYRKEGRWPERAAFYS